MNCIEQDCNNEHYHLPLWTPGSAQQSDVLHTRERQTDWTQLWLGKLECYADKTDNNKL